MQLLMSLEPRIAFFMTADDRAARHFDATMARLLLKYTAAWRFDEQHWLLVSLMSSAQGLAILADEKKAQKVAKYAEDLYARNPTSSRRRVDCHGAVAHHRWAQRWAQNKDAKNEYFELLRILKNRQMRVASAQILNDIVNGTPCVLGKSFKPQRTRGQDFTCSCTWEPPVRAAQDASTATSSGQM